MIRIASRLRIASSRAVQGALGADGAALGLAAGSIYSVTQLTPTEKDFRFETFDKDSALHRYIDQIIDHYAELINDAPIDVYWGIDAYDRTGTDPNNPFDPAAAAAGGVGSQLGRGAAGGAPRATRAPRSR